MESMRAEGPGPIPMTVIVPGSTWVRPNMKKVIGY